MTLDFVTLIATLFRSHQWSILLSSSKRVEVNSSKLLLCEDMVEASAKISAMYTDLRGTPETPLPRFELTPEI